VTITAEMVRQAMVKTRGARLLQAILHAQKNAGVPPAAAAMGTGVNIFSETEIGATTPADTGNQDVSDHDSTA
jgi:hypothetical protein